MKFTVFDGVLLSLVCLLSVYIKYISQFFTVEVDNFIEQQNEEKKKQKAKNQDNPLSRIPGLRDASKKQAKIVSYCHCRRL